MVWGVTKCGTLYDTNLKELIIVEWELKGNSTFYPHDYKSSASGYQKTILRARKKILKNMACPICHSIDTHKDNTTWNGLKPPARLMYNKAAFPKITDYCNDCCYEWGF